MGMPGTEIIVKGSASDDAGWINCGARITVLGDVTNGAFNAAAQGILYVQGSGGARCDTMTKHNPRFEPPQSWYFRNVGDSFAEFKAGGIAVICGVNPRNPEQYPRIPSLCWNGRRNNIFQRADPGIQRKGCEAP